MQVTTTGIHSERTGGVSSGFPSRESERVIEELRNGGMGNGFLEEGEKGTERNIEEHMHHQGFAVKFGFFGVQFELGSGGEEQRGNGEKGWAG